MSAHRCDWCSQPVGYLQALYDEQRDEMARLDNQAESMGWPFRHWDHEDEVVEMKSRAASYQDESAEILRCLEARA